MSSKLRKKDRNIDLSFTPDVEVKAGGLTEKELKSLREDYPIIETAEIASKLMAGKLVLACDVLRSNFLGNTVLKVRPENAFSYSPKQQSFTIYSLLDSYDDPGKIDLIPAGMIPLDDETQEEREAYIKDYTDIALKNYTFCAVMPIARMGKVYPSPMMAVTV